MKKSLRIVLALMVIAGFVLAACQPAAGTATPSTSATQAPAATSGGASGEKIELVMWEQSAEWRIKAQQSTIDAFEKEHPNVTIRIESFPFVEYLPKINNAMQAGTAADIITIVGQWAPPLIQAGLVEPIPASVITPDQLLATFWEGPAQEAIFNGQVYMFPNHVTMGTGGLVYNEDLVKEAGIAIPPKFNTWDEFMQAAQKCTKFDANGTMTQAGFSAHGVIDSFMGLAFMMQEGNEVIKDNQIQFNNAGGEAALQVYQDIFRKWKVDDPEFPGGLDAFPQGRVCFMNIGAWAGKAAQEQNAKLHVAFGPPPPSINPANPAYVQADTQWQFIVNSKSQHKDVIWEFLKFYNQKDQWVNRVQFDGEVPALKEATQAFADDPVLSAYVQSAPLAKWSGYKVDREKFNNTVNTYLEQLARGDLTPKAALEGLTNDLNAILSGQ
jgi:multiple sugar transport system substrate-binding protein